MKNIFKWFVNLKRKKKILIVRIILCFLVFVVCWLLITVIGKLFLDEENTRKYLDEHNLLRFVKASIRKAIINNYWKILIAAILSVISYKWFKGLANKIVGKYFDAKHLLDIWLSSFSPGLPVPEFIFILPSISYPCKVNFRSNSEDIRINAIEIVPSIYKEMMVDSYNKQKIQQEFSFLDFAKGEDDEENEKGLKWIKGKENTFSINTPFTLPEGSEIGLPLIYPVSKEKDVIELTDYIGDAKLMIDFRINLDVAGDRIVKNISAPLRIFRLVDEGIEDYNLAVIEGIDQIASKSKNSLEAYKNMTKDFLFDLESGKQVAGQVAYRESLLEDIREYKKKLRVNPDNTELNLDLARALRDTMQYEESMQYMNKVFDMGFDDPDFHSERVMVGSLIGANSEVKSSLDRLLVLRPDDVEANTEMGTLLSMEEKNEEALNYINKALRIDPDFSLALFWKGRIMNEFEKYSEALELLNSVIQKEPEFREPVIDQAYSLLKLGREEEALRSIEKVIQMGFDDLNWLEHLGGMMGASTKKKFDKLIAPLKD